MHSTKSLPLKQIMRCILISSLRDQTREGGGGGGRNVRTFAANLKLEVMVQI